MVRISLANLQFFLSPVKQGAAVRPSARPKPPTYLSKAASPSNGAVMSD